MSLFRTTGFAALRPNQHLFSGLNARKNIASIGYPVAPTSNNSLFCRGIFSVSAPLSTKPSPPSHPSLPAVGIVSHPKQQKAPPGSRQFSILPSFKWRGFSSYYNEFKSAPGSHLTSFLILHELTAILPLGTIFLFLQYSGFQPLDFKSLSPEAIELAAKPARYVLKLFGYEEASLHTGSSVFVNLVISYFLVKLAGPARIVLSAALTPWFSRVVVQPVIGLVTRNIKPKKN